MTTGLISAMCMGWGLAAELSLVVSNGGCSTLFYSMKMVSKCVTVGPILMSLSSNCTLCQIIYTHHVCHQSLSMMAHSSGLHANIQQRVCFVWCSAISCAISYRSFTWRPLCLQLGIKLGPSGCGGCCAERFCPFRILHRSLLAAVWLLDGGSRLGQGGSGCYFPINWRLEKVLDWF